MTTIIATSKERLVKYLDFKGIGKKEFYETTGIKRGFLDTNKLKSSFSETFLTIIFENYEDLNKIWLITGEGNMIIEEDNGFIDNGTNKIEVQKIVDLIMVHKEKFESNPVFKSYLSNHKKDAIIDYQNNLLSKTNQ